MGFGEVLAPRWRFPANSRQHALLVRALVSCRETFWAEKEGIFMDQGSFNSWKTSFRPVGGSFASKDRGCQITCYDSSFRRLDCLNCPSLA